MAESRSMRPPEPLRSALATCKRHFIYAGIFSALVNLLYLAPTLYLMQVYDRVLPTGGMLTLIWISLIALAAFAVLGLLNDVRVRLLIRSSLRLERQLAPILLVRLYEGKPRESASEARRRLRILRDFDAFRQTVTGPGFAALMDAPWTPIYILTAFILHPMVGVVTLVSSAILVGLAVLNERTMRTPLRDADRGMSDAHMLQDSINRRADIVRALGMRKALARVQYEKRSLALDLQARASMRTGAYASAIKALRLIFQSAVLGVAVILAVNGHITAGAIIAASLLMGRALAPLDQLVGAWSGLVQGRDAYHNIIDFFSETPERKATMVLPPPKGRLSVEALSVGTETSRILNNVSFSVEAGQILGVVGPSGAGKTTLLSAIAGARGFDSGAIRFDDARLEDWDPDRLAGFIGYVPQDSALLAGTVYENICRYESHMGVDPATVDAAVVEAAKRAGAHEMILQLDGGYQFVLGPTGQGLSAGQAQRVALARALYGEPVYLILDEPNSNLDPQGQFALMTSLKALKERGTTILIAAHRTSALANADMLMIMRDGHLTACGPASEIAAKLRTLSPASPYIRAAV
jgi:PrtD family type I secretion system ABC transporter